MPRSANFAQAALEAARIVNVVLALWRRPSICRVSSRTALAGCR